MPRLLAPGAGGEQQGLSTRPLCPAVLRGGGTLGAAGPGGRCPRQAEALRGSPACERVVRRAGAGKREVTERGSLPAAARLCSTVALRRWGKGKEDPLPEFRGAPAALQSGGGSFVRSQAAALATLSCFTWLELRAGAGRALLGLECSSVWQLSPEGGCSVSAQPLPPRCFSVMFCREVNSS